MAIKDLLRLCLIASLLLIFWQGLVVVFDLPEFLLPTPLTVCQTLLTQWPLLLHHLLPTLYEIMIGFLAGIFFGCLAGLVAARFRTIAAWFFPLLVISQSIPTFAIAPLIVLWLGYGIASKIAITILVIFFPITSAFYDGLRQTPDTWLEMAKTMNASPLRTLWFIRLPAALPSLASGIRISVVIAPIGAIVGEWVGSSQGLGYLMLNANARLQIDQMFAALLLIMLSAWLLYWLIDKLLRTAVFWL